MTNNLSLYLLILAIIIAGKALIVIFLDRPENPIRYFYARLDREDWFNRIVANLPMLLALAAFMPMFSAMKSAIPLFTPFDWDQTFIRWDIALHGTDPWRLLQPILGFPAVTYILSVLYQLWLALIYVGSMFFCLFARDEKLRLRYFVAYFLSWSLLGIFGAQYLASVGPCFLLPLMGDASFLELMGYLYEVDKDTPLISLRIQETLIRASLVKNYELGSGITAMPSMHVALAFLFAIAMVHQNGVLGVLFMGYAFVILLSSVHLGFHYAVDGYISIIGVAAIWWVSGLIARYEIRQGRSAPSGSEPICA